MTRSQRPLHLDAGVPSRNAFGSPADGRGQTDARSRQQLADQGRNLRELLARARNARPEPGAKPPAADPAIASPFDLFRAAETGAPHPQPPTPSATLTHTLEQMARHLLVADGRSGRRGVQIALADAQLPGVVVDVFEDAGRLVACFTCSQEASRERLCAAARWLADGLAQRLQRDSRVQVQTDDPEDACVLQVDSDH